MSTGTHPESGPTKSLWSDADFDEMGWHDGTIHGLCVQPGAPDGSLPPRLLLDIDYIVRRVHPVAPQTHFSFWTAPSTLVFDDVWDFEGDLDFKGMGSSLQIDHLRRSTPEDSRRGPQWHLEGRPQVPGHGIPPVPTPGAPVRAAACPLEQRARRDLVRGDRLHLKPTAWATPIGTGAPSPQTLPSTTSLPRASRPRPSARPVSRRGASARCRPPAARPPRSAALRTAP